MKAITLARKPLIGTVAKNVLEYGGGGLNIDGSRIACPNEKITTHSQSKGSANNRVIFEAGSEWAGIDTHQTEGQKLGRFPANLILQHLDGCRCDGVKKVTTNVQHHSYKRSGEGFIGNIKSQPEKAHWTNKETVANWVCETGCPVKEIDEQSVAGGMHSAGSSRTASRSAGKTGMFPMDGDGHRFGDSGGASRFFKQVKK